MRKSEAFAFLKELESKGIILGLARIKKFLRLLGNPEKRFVSIHIAGTNAKGSVAAMIEAILRNAGYKTALYTSPHLLRLNERIKVNAKEISDKQLFSLIEELKQHMEKSRIQLTHFEFVTALAFLHFARCNVDFAVVETGMGGRLDATNVLKPAASIITHVAIEHQQYLGKTIKNIAREKAGIIKPRVPTITAETKKSALSVFRKICAEKKSKLLVIKKPFNGKIGLLGFFQKINAAVAIAAVYELQAQGISVSRNAILQGIAKTKWPGRFEIVQRKPTVILDCCHNPDAAVALAKAFKQIFPGKKAILAVGISSDKDAAKVVSLLSPIAKSAIVTEAAFRALPAEKIKKEFEKNRVGAIEIKRVKNAAKKAIKAAGTNGIVLITGSCFVVGEALKLWRRKA